MNHSLKLLLSSLSMPEDWALFTDMRPQRSGEVQCESEIVAFPANQSKLVVLCSSYVTFKTTDMPDGGGTHL